MSNKFIKTDRRNFLKGAAVAGGTAVIAPNAAVADVKIEAVKEPAIKDKGYEENDYIRTYYDRARF